MIPHTKGHPFEIIRNSGYTCQHCGGTVGAMSDICLDCDRPHGGSAFGRLEFTVAAVVLAAVLIARLI